MSNVDDPNGCSCTGTHALQSSYPTESLGSRFGVLTEVRFKSQNMPLGDVAVWLDGLVSEQIAIPADRMNSTPVSGEFERITVSDLLHELGLVDLGRDRAHGGTVRSSASSAERDADREDLEDFMPHCC